MTRIEVAPATLSETADRLRAAGLDVARIRRDLAAAGPTETGSPELSAALAEHADAWGWCLDRLHDRARAAARALDSAAAAYESVEGAVTGAATTGRRRSGGGARQEE